MLIYNVDGIEVRAYEDEAGVRRVALMQDERLLFDRAAPNQTMTLEHLLQVHAFVVGNSLERRRRMLNPA